MADHPLESGAQPIAHRLAAGLSKIGLSLKRRLWRDGAGVRRISPLQAQVLTFLRQQPRHSATVTEIAKALAVTLPTASEVVSTLTKRGLLRKIRLEDDARVVIVLLTPKGRRRAEQVSGWPDFLAWAAETLPVQEQEMLLRIVIKLIHSIQGRGEIPIAKMCVTCSHFRPNIHDDPVQPHHCALFNAPFGNRLLRIECPEHKLAEPLERERLWATFMQHDPRAEQISLSISE